MGAVCLESGKGNLSEAAKCHKKQGGWNSGAILHISLSEMKPSVRPCYNEKTNRRKNSGAGKSWLFCKTFYDAEGEKKKKKQS